MRVSAEIHRAQRRQSGQHGLPPAPADAAAAEQRAQGQHSALAGVREQPEDLPDQAGRLGLVAVEFYYTRRAD